MSLATFFVLMFYFNLVTLGKGLLMIPLIEGHMVKDAGVLTQSQLLTAVAIGQVTPGPANFYVTAVGYMAFGLPGALAALVAVAAPSFTAIILMRGYQRLKTNFWAQAFFKGLTTTALGLIFYSAFTLGQAAISSVQAVIVFLAGFVMIHFLKVNPILALFIASALGLGLYFVGVAAV